jgi:recombination protein RecA
MVKPKKEKQSSDKSLGLAGLRKHLLTAFPDAITGQGCKEVIETGSSKLDKALGIGGLPRGRIVELYGNESSGKSTLCLSVCANAMKKGLACLYIDYEHALNDDHALSMGVDVNDEKFIKVQPTTHEEGMNLMEQAIASKEIGLVVIDSIAAAVPKAELEGEIGDQHMGLQARLNSQMLRMVTGPLAKTNCLLMVVNQTRMKIGVQWGSPVTTTGGNGMKFYASIRLDLAKIETLKEGEDVVGIKTRVKVVKNKMASPMKEATFDIRFGYGIDEASDVLDEAVEAKKILTSGAWFALASGEKIGQGRNNALAWLRKNRDKWEELRSTNE